MSQKLNDKQETQYKSLEAYLQFLEQYWKLFKPPTEPKKKKEYKNVLL
jgi:hypothetical protein